MNVRIFHKRVQDIAGVVFIIKKSTDIKFVSPSVERMLGYKPEDMTNKKIFEFTHDQDHARLQTYLDTILERSSLVMPLSLRLLHADGLWRRFEIVSANYLDVSKVGGIVLYAYALGLKKQMAAARESEARYRRIVNLAPDGIATVNTKGIVNSCNESFLRITGFSAKEIVGKHFTELPTIRAKDMPGFATIFKDLACGNTPKPFEITWVHRRGSEQLAEIRIGLMKNKGKVTDILAIARDITERKRTEDLIKIQRDLELNLRNTTDFHDGLSLCLQAALHVPDLDCGGIYLVDENSGNLNLACHRELSHSFIELTSHFEPDSENAKLVKKGKIIYTHSSKLCGLIDSMEKEEGLKAIAIVPVYHQQEVIGCLNVASHTSDELQDYTREALESIANQIGNAIINLRTTEALRRSEARYRTLVDLLPEGIYEIDLDGNFMLANKRAFEMSGYDRDDLERGLHVSRIFVPEDHKRLEENIKCILNGQRLGPTEYTAIKKDGTRYPIITHSVRMTEDGETTGIRGIVIDNTDRKRTEEALRTSEEKYRSLIEQSLQGFMIVRDDPNRFAFVNSAIAEILGYTTQEMKHFHETQVIMLIHPKDRPTVLRHFRNRLRGKPSPQNLEFRAIKKDGSTCWLRAFSNAIEYNGKQALQIVFLDMTEQKHASETVRRSEERYRTLFENSPTSLWEEDFSDLKKFLDGLRSCGIKDIKTYLDENPDVVRECVTMVKVVDANRAALRLYKAPDKDALKSRFADLFDEDSYKAFKAEIINIASGQTNFESEISTRTLDGEKIIGVLNFSVLPGHEKTFSKVLVAITDVTDRRMRQEALVRFQKLESLGILAGGIAHDFNNILTSMLGNIEIMKLSTSMEDETLNRLTKLEQITLRARHLTQQLLTFSKGGVPMKKAIDFGKVIRDATIFALRGSNTKAEFSIANGLWAIEADEGQMNQVINNLIINAIQAMPQGGTIELNAQNVTIESDAGPTLPSGKYVKLTIKDEGTGIPSEYLPKIFDPFFTTKRDGSGLGLAITYSIIKKHSGSISAESKLGDGTTLTIHLPARGQVKLGNHEAEHEICFGQGRILIMDDEESIRDTAAKMLECCGYQVLLAKDGMEAIETYKKETAANRQVDAVIMDLTVPGNIGGKTAIGRLLAIDPRAKVIVSSGYSNDPIMADFAKYGFKNVLSKPYKLHELSAVVNKVMQEGSPSKDVE